MFQITTRIEDMKQFWRVLIDVEHPPSARRFAAIGEGRELHHAWKCAWQSADGWMRDFLPTRQEEPKGGGRP